MSSAAGGLTTLQQFLRIWPDLSAAAALALGCLLSDAAAQPAFSPPREIRVVTDINYPPYLFPADDGQLQGILKDKWALWSQRTGIPARVEGMEWAKAQESVLEGKADVIEALAYTAGRAGLYEYSPAYAPIEARVYFHRSISGIKDVDSMRGFAIAAKEGSACGGWLAEREINTLRDFPNSEVLVQLAGEGEVRMFCMDTPAARYFLFKHGLDGEFRETPPLYTTQFHWAVKKGRVELRDFIQAGFDKINAAELEDINERWLGSPLRFRLDERLLYSLALLSAALIGTYVLLVVWNRSLRLRVSAKTAELSTALESVRAHADQVRESEERFSRMFRLSPSAIMVSSVAEGRVIDANEALLRIADRTRGEVIGRTTVELGFWDTAGERVGVLEKLRDREGGVVQFERTARTPAGATKDTMITATLLELQGGQVMLSMIQDITERRRAERLLRESEARLAKIVEASPQSISITDVEDGTYVEVNRACERQCGYTREELIGKSAVDLGFWPDPEERKRFIAELRRDGAVQAREVHLRHKNGNVRELLASAALIEIEGRQLMLFQGVDVTERQRAERLLEESERRLAKVIEASPMSIAINSIEDGRFVEANPAFEKLWGYTRDELIGRAPVELGFWPVPEDRERFIAELQRDGVVYGREFRLRRKDGEPRDILASTALIELNGRKFSLFQSLDITERKRAERLLEESERRLATVIEASPEAITIATIDDGTFIQVNPAAERLGGYTREEMIGRSAVDLGFWADLEERRRLVADLQRGEEVHGREVHLRHKTGVMRDILASAALIDLKGRRFILFQGIDITEQKAAEKALREQELVLRELSAHHEVVREGERAHIAREIHDELGQALTALKMELSVAGMKSGKAASRMKEPVQGLKARVDSIIQTVRDVATALRPAALDLGFLPGVEWLVGEFRRRTGIRCTVSLTGRDIVLPDDRSIVLFRILQESLTNIARHARARKVEILLDHDTEYVRMDVQDDGVGFDVAEARGRKTFGLLGMRERAIMLRGEMRITSARGRGTRISVSMPIA